ncbi:MAG: GNAT family N-acetyltransferase [Oscillospiraceae bacterium]|nr:GNAT family N-acetyltransferase [Oscillospiraceae bacterium]
MLKLRHASEQDRSFWFTLDAYMHENEFDRKIRDNRAYIITADHKPIGILRYNLFWDNTPFLTLIHLEEAHQRKGFGKQAMLQWEAEMRALGYKLVLTSTQVNEPAQHFYRALGYIEKGALFLDHTPMEQPQEMFMMKVL